MLADVNHHRTTRCLSDFETLLDAASWATGGEDDLPLREGRVVRALHHLIVEAVRVGQAGLGVRAISISHWLREDAGRSPRTLAGSTATAFQVDLNARRIEVKFDGSRVLPLAERLMGTIAELLRASICIMQDAERADPRGASEPIHRAHELLVVGFARSIGFAFLRGFIEQELTNVVRFFLGHTSFQRGFPAAQTLWDWILDVRAETFEGTLLRTGLVLDSSDDWGGPGTLCEFQQAWSFGEFIASPQRIVMADGAMTFVRIGPDCQVRGLVALSEDIGKLVTNIDPGSPLKSSGTAGAIWISLDDHRSPKIYASLADHFHQIANARKGLIHLVGSSELETAIEALVSVVGECRRPDAEALLKMLVERGRSGHGGGVVVGQLRPEEDVGIEHKFAPPFPTVSVLGSALLTLMNPDGALLLSSALEIEATGYILRAKPKERLAGSGSRHAALMAATEDVEATAIAVSDDGGVTVFRRGEVIARLR